MRPARYQSFSGSGLIFSLCFTLALPITLLFISGSPAYGDDQVVAADTLVVRDSLPAGLEAPRPVGQVRAADVPDDGGGSIRISWSLSPDDYADGPVTSYDILRAGSPDGPFEPIGSNVRGNGEFVDGKTTDGINYYYQVVAVIKAVDNTGAPYKIVSPAVLVGPSQSRPQWFNRRRFLCLLLTLLVSASIIMFIRKAKRGEDLFIRKIAGINAVEEAVGRATEMGRKVFFVPGIQDMNDVQTIAGIAILGRVAALAAEYETWLEVPVSKSMVMVTARETMKEAYASVGRPDSYQEAQVHYLTDDQFGYAAAIDGMVVRERPATIFYMGAFFAESLILAETGNAAGAIQIAGTAMPAQLPFFIAACDYTLIGEELFAASAYLSREPRQLGSLKGQDVGKAVFLVAIIIGFILELLGVKIFGYMPSDLFKVQ